MNSNLVLPFLTYFREDFDYNANDVNNEIKLMIFRNNVIEDYLMGTQDETYMFDVLASQGIDPNIYMESVEEQIEYLMSNPNQLYCN